MPTITCVPDNINPLSSGGYLFSINKLPELTYFCQQVNLPSISIDNPEFANPMVKVLLPGDFVTFEPLRVDFLIDSKMKNYRAIYDWLRAIGFPESNEDYTNYAALNTNDSTQQGAFGPLLSDATLTILDNNNNPISIVEFEDCYPTTLETLTFQSTQSDVNYLVGSVSFNYTMYKFI